MNDQTQNASPQENDNDKDLDAAFIARITELQNSPEASQRVMAKFASECSIPFFRILSEERLKSEGNPERLSDVCIGVALFCVTLIGATSDFLAEPGRQEELANHMLNMIGDFIAEEFERREGV